MSNVAIQPNATAGINLFGQTSTTATAATRRILSGRPVVIAGATTGGGMFGQPAANNTTTGTGLFGQPPVTPTTGTGLFGQLTANAISTQATGGLFGQPAATRSNSVRGRFGSRP